MAGSDPLTIKAKTIKVCMLIPALIGCGFVLLGGVVWIMPKDPGSIFDFRPLFAIPLIATGITLLGLMGISLVRNAVLAWIGIAASLLLGSALLTGVAAYNFATHFDLEPLIDVFALVAAIGFLSSGILAYQAYKIRTARSAGSS